MAGNNRVPPDSMEMMKTPKSSARGKSAPRVAQKPSRPKPGKRAPAPRRAAGKNPLLQAARSLINFRLAASDGEVGHVRDIYFDSHTWKVRYLVVKTGAWLFGKAVLIPARALGRVNEADSSIGVGLTMAEIKQAPARDTNRPISRQDETPYLEGSYFAPGIAPWIALHASAPAEVPPPEDQPPVEEHRDFHLCSVHDVIGYALEGTDEKIGHVTDVQVADADWSIRGFTVATSVLSGQELTVPTAVVREISAETRTVYLSVPRASLDATSNS